jgi:hypothetical protein
LENDRIAIRNLKFFPRDAFCPLLCSLLVAIFGCGRLLVRNLKQGKGKTIRVVTLREILHRRHKTFPAAFGNLKNK